MRTLRALDAAETAGNMAATAAFIREARANYDLLSDISERAEKVRASGGGTTVHISTLSLGSRGHTEWRSCPIPGRPWSPASLRESSTSSVLMCARIKIKTVGAKRLKTSRGCYAKTSDNAERANPMLLGCLSRAFAAVSCGPRFAVGHAR